MPATLITGVDSIQNLTKLIPCLTKEGHKRAARYYSDTTRMPEKVLRHDEASALSKAGFQIVTVFEDLSNYAGYFTAGRGHNDATAALTQARAAVQPAGSGIYFAVDYDAAKADLPGIIAYFTSVRSILNKDGAGPYKIGGYGSGLVLSTLLAAGLIEFAWLSQSAGFAGTRQFRQSGRWSILQLLASAAPEHCGNFDYDPDIFTVNDGSWRIA